MEMKKCGFLFTSLHLVVTDTLSLGLLGMQNRTAKTTQVQHDGLGHFSCPSSGTTGEVATYQSHFEALYAWQAEEVPDNVTKFLLTFRNKDYDHWGMTYEEMKEAHYEWKDKHFALHLQSGDSIYESACGIGLNLHMTLEILNEVKGIESLVVNGHDIVQASAKRAAWLFDSAHPYKSQLGAICTADSTNLSFVPSNSFDMVFTGYMSPLTDMFHQDFDVFESSEQLRDLCTEEDKESRRLSEYAQERQNHFYAKWASEMIRITKPGKSIIFEHVGRPICENPVDLGGVAKEWWRLAIEEYSWDVDPDSLLMEDEKAFPHLNRYHVYMRKNLGEWVGKEGKKVRRNRFQCWGDVLLNQHIYRGTTCL